MAESRRRCGPSPPGAAGGVTRRPTRSSGRRWWSCAFILYPVLLAATQLPRVGRVHAGVGAVRRPRQLPGARADEVFWKAALNSVLFVVVRTPLEVGIAFGLALLLNRRLVARSFLRTMFFVPVVMSLIVVTMIFQRVLEPNTGLLNTFLRARRSRRAGVSLARRSGTALPAVIVVWVWKNVGFSLVILLAGLQGLPQEVLEAARVDGANAWQLTLRVIVPLMKPIIAITASCRSSVASRCSTWSSS